MRQFMGHNNIVPKETLDVESLFSFNHFIPEKYRGIYKKKCTKIAEEIEDLIKLNKMLTSCLSK